MDRINISEVLDTGSIPVRETKLPELAQKLAQYSFDYNRIRADIFRILEENNYPSQIGLTHTDRAVTDHDKLYESIGSAYNEDKTRKFLETDFTIFNEAYRDTYLYEVYNTIPNLGRFRIMTMDGPKCYTIHRDQTRRYHYVIETDPNCLFLFPDIQKQIHIPQDGNLYLVETRHNHTFVNGSRRRRIHLVMDDLSTI